MTHGSNHVRYRLADHDPAPGPRPRLIGWIEDERLFRVERPLHFFLGPDEGFSGDDLKATLDTMLEQNRSQEWRQWVRALATPVEWQEAVIRSAITLKLCQHEETGAIVAALTTSIPELAGSRPQLGLPLPSWIRDAYYTVQALNRLGALDVLESYLEYLRNVVDNAKGGHHDQPLYGVGGEARLDERVVAGLNGYRGMGPVRVGNDAYAQVQHDAYGQIVLSNTQAFFDQRLYRVAGPDDFKALETVGDRAWAAYDQPAEGRGAVGAAHQVACPHLFGAAMCWAAVRSAGQRGRDARASAASARSFGATGPTPSAGQGSRRRRLARRQTGRLSATFAGDDLDASLIQLLDLRFVKPGDARLLRDPGARSKRGSDAARTCCAMQSKWSTSACRMTAFNVATFWLDRGAARDWARTDARESEIRGDAGCSAGQPRACCPKTSIRSRANCGETIRKPIPSWD